MQPEQTATHPQRSSVLVWDVPTRLFHWTLVGAFVLAYLTSESERWQLWHITAGYVFGFLLLFRVVWGVIGTRYARFSDFVSGPRAVRRYLGTLLTRHPAHYIGHNPAGAWAILAILGLGALTVLTGWASFNDYGDWIGELHEAIVNLLLLVVVMHVAGVVVSSLLHRENLVRAMVNGRKMGLPTDAIRYPQWIIGILLITTLLIFIWALLTGHIPGLLP